MEKTENNRGKWIVFFFVAVGIFMSTLDSSIVNVALPTIMKDFDVALSTMEWVVMIYLLTVSSLLLNFGRLSDIRGRRWVYSRGLVVFSLASLLCGLAPGAYWLIVFRLFQGIGAAMIMACTPALVVDTFPAAERGKALGMVGTVVAAGLTAGPALGGALLHLFPWPVIFYINVPIGMASAWIVSRLLRGSGADRSREEKFDWFGAPLLVASLVCLLICISHGYMWGIASIPTLTLAGSGLLCLVLFIYVESRVSDPIMDLSLFSIRLFTLPVISAVAMFMTLFAVVFLMPFYLVHPSGFSVDRVGMIMVTPFVFLFFLSPISGTVYDRLGSRGLCSAGMLCLSGGLFALSALPASAPVPQILWRLALVGIGTAVFLPPNSSAAMTAVPAVRRGTAAATVAMARNLGMVVGVAQAGAIFNRTFARLTGGETLHMYDKSLETAFMSAFRSALIAAGLVGLVGAVLAFGRGKDSPVRDLRET
jgi:EmrB/QacA subfamily drug resistance transporter